MPRDSVKSNATFVPSVYLRSIAEMFTRLDRSEQRDLVERMAVLPRHIHQMANSGLIAVPARVRSRR